MRLAVVCLLAVTGATSAAPKQAVPSLTAQDLRDVADGALTPEDVTYQIPQQDRLRAIPQLIRKGASCKRTDHGCTELGTYESPGAKDTQRSPCFRRWYLYTLLVSLDPDQQLRLDAGELRAVTKLDIELIDAIGSRLESEQQVELAYLLSEQKREVTFDLDLDFPLAKKALQKYHLDEAVDFIAADVAPDLLIGVALDPRYRVATRVDALQRLSNESDMEPERLAQIIRPLLAAPSLEIAAEVANIIGADLTRPPTVDRGFFMRMLALAVESGAEADVILSYTPRGLDIVSPMGVPVDHVGPTKPVNPDEAFYSDAEDVMSEIQARRHQPPIFGVDSHGALILVGFLDVPAPEAPASSCQELEADIY